jgi:hypothetical protein
MKHLFSNFGKAYSEWFDGRGTKFIMTNWLIKEQFSSPCILVEFKLNIEHISGHI